MSPLPKITHLAAIDPDFRAALLADPQTALAQWGLGVNADELAILSDLAHLLALPSQALLARLLTVYWPPFRWQPESLSACAVCGDVIPETA